MNRVLLVLVLSLCIVGCMDKKHNAKNKDNVVTSGSQPPNSSLVKKSPFSSSLDPIELNSEVVDKEVKQVCAKYKELMPVLDTTEATFMTMSSRLSEWVDKQQFQTIEAVRPWPEGFLDIQRKDRDVIIIRYSESKP